MRIVEIEVEGLFGTFHHKIPLNLEDRITIIHGPNGFGKTVLLEMVHGLFEGDYEPLFRVPFDRLQLHFDGDRRLVIGKSSLHNPPSKGQRLFSEEMFGVEVKALPRLTFQYSIVDSVQSVDVQLFIVFSRHEKGLSYQESRLKWWDPTRASLASQISFVAQPPPSAYSFDEELDPIALLEDDSASSFPPRWWNELIESTPIYVIHEQRRMRLKERSTRYVGEPSAELEPVVVQYAEELAETIQDCLADSAELSQRLDRTFPNRLIQRIGKNGPVDGDLEAKLKTLEAKRAKLRRVGLLDPQEDVGLLAPPPDLGDEARDLLAVYVEDTEKKLGIFDDLADRIELFTDIVNDRFQYKRLRVTKEKGFFLETEDGDELSLDVLSSGEQHELVLVYQLLFKLEPNALVLIDEPELSLHVVWQQKFLEDLSRMTKLASFDALVATHSPQIIHDRWDLTVELKGPDKLKDPDKKEPDKKSRDSAA